MKHSLDAVISETGLGLGEAEPKLQKQKISGTVMSNSFQNPTNPLVGPLLTDMYQISMSYAHWKSHRHNDHAVFDLFYRTNPFHGEFCIFAGSDEVLRFISSFSFTESDVDYLKNLLGAKCHPDFFTWLRTLDCSQIKVYMVKEGSIVFPREPLIRIEGPLVIGQLLETTLLNLINFPSLVATCAARMRLAAGQNKTLFEFGLRRAQGPDGGLSASKYAYIGGFNGTSNVLAGKLFGIDVTGTHAHAYVMAHIDLNDLYTRLIYNEFTKCEIDFVDLVMEIRVKLDFKTTNLGELAAFIEYAQAFPTSFLALVDTYDTLQSGVPNFICVAIALLEIGYEPRGIRLDSGDLAYLSKETRKMFLKFEKYYLEINTNTNITKSFVSNLEQQQHQAISVHNKGHTGFLSKLVIVASNDINEKVIRSLNEETHEIDTFGIGTHLVTCYEQPALGCVYKLVEINKTPRIKLSQNVEKLVIPGCKCVYRLFGKDGYAILDVMQFATEPAPTPGQAILCRDAFRENKRCMVTPARVEALLTLAWDNGILAPNHQVYSNSGIESSNNGTSKAADNVKDTVLVNLNETRAYCKKQLLLMREDHIRGLNATPYKTSVSQALYDFLHQLWAKEAPIAELS